MTPIGSLGKRSQTGGRYAGGREIPDGSWCGLGQGGRLSEPQCLPTFNKHLLGIYRVPTSVRVLGIQEEKQQLLSLGSLPPAGGER